MKWTAATMNLIMIFYHLSGPFESVIPVLRSWACNFNQWQRHLSELCPLYLHPVQQCIWQRSSCPPFSSGVPADIYLTCCQGAHLGLFGQQQCSTWNATWISLLQLQNIAQDYHPSYLLWQPLLNLIFATPFNSGFELWSSLVQQEAPTFC